MHFVISLFFGVSCILAQECDQCPLPNIDPAALAPCLNNRDSSACCTYGRVLAQDPCVRVWLTMPQLVPYLDLIRDLRDDCGVQDFPPCNETVAEACPKECAIDTTGGSNATMDNDDNDDDNWGLKGASMTGDDQGANATLTVDDDDDAIGANDTQAIMSDDDDDVKIAAVKTGDMGMQTCEEGEEFTKCQSSSCFEATCTDGQVKKPGPICTADCKQGCRCMDGWARNETSGECVTEKDCADSQQQECGANEEFETCGSSSCWEPHCQDGRVIVPGPMCTMDCRQGCKCATGFVRDRTIDACIPEQQCVPRTGKLGKVGKGKLGKMGKMAKAGKTR